MQTFVEIRYAGTHGKRVNTVHFWVKMTNSVTATKSATKSFYTHAGVIGATDCHRNVRISGFFARKWSSDTLRGVSGIPITRGRLENVVLRCFLGVTGAVLI